MKKADTRNIKDALQFEQCIYGLTQKQELGVPIW